MFIYLSASRPAILFFDTTEVNTLCTLKTISKLTAVVRKCFGVNNCSYVIFYPGTFSEASDVICYIFLGAPSPTHLFSFCSFLSPLSLSPPFPSSLAGRLSPVPVPRASPLSARPCSGGQELVPRACLQRAVRAALCARQSQRRLQPAAGDRPGAGDTGRGCCSAERWVLGGRRRAAAEQSPETRHLGVDAPKIPGAAPSILTREPGLSSGCPPTPMGVCAGGSPSLTPPCPAAGDFLRLGPAPRAADCR